VSKRFGSTVAQNHLTSITWTSLPAGCADLTSALPAAAERLSDYCPVVVEIQDRDLECRGMG
jgi:hypothetical protein